MERNTLSRADHEKGRLRTFLLGSLQNFLFNEHDRAHSKEVATDRLFQSINMCPKWKRQ